MLLDFIRKTLLGCRPSERSSRKTLRPQSKQDHEHPNQQNPPPPRVTREGILIRSCTASRHLRDYVDRRTSDSRPLQADAGFKFLRCRLQTPDRIASRVTAAGGGDFAGLVVLYPLFCSGPQSLCETPLRRAAILI